MQKLPRISGNKLIKILAKIGFEIRRQKRSHVILENKSESLKKIVVVPKHKEIDKGTLLEIIRQCGLKKKNFLKIYRKI